MYTERNQKMLRRRENGESYASIAQSYGVSESRVCQICHEMKNREKEQNMKVSQNEITETNTTSEKKAVAYLIACIPDDSMVYVNMQSPRMKRLAESLGCELLSIYYENPGEMDCMTRMIKECREKGISLIIARSLQRFGRTIEETWRIVEYLNNLDHPIGVYFYEHGLLTTDKASLASWKLFTDMLED